MNPPGSVSTASSNKTEQQLQLALPLAAIISLSITCYVIAVVVGIAVRNWLIKMCCCSVPTSDEKNCDCDIFPSCSFESVQDLYGCCKQSSSNTTCCNAGISKLKCGLCSFFTECCMSSSSRPIDCQSCDCCCFEIAFHIKRSSPANGSNTAA